jgi:transcriptional regulator with XRE-family HTH domain
MELQDQFRELVRQVGNNHQTARKAGISRRALLKWLSGDSDFGARNLQRLASALKIKLSFEVDDDQSSQSPADCGTVAGCGSECC